MMDKLIQKIKYKKPSVYISANVFITVYTKTTFTQQVFLGSIQKLSYWLF